MKLTQSRLKKLLDYDPETGIFLWKISVGSNVQRGDDAGYTREDGYIQIRTGGKHYLAHRLAWLHYYGYFPENDLDHIDRIRIHNWIKNLRETTRQCNIRNTGNFSHNTSGVKGVSFAKCDQKWRSRIRIGDKNHHLGLFEDFTESVAHRLTAEQCESWENCDSLSPAFKFMQKYIKGLALR